MHCNSWSESYMKAWGCLYISFVSTQVLHSLTYFVVHVRRHVRKQPIHSARRMERRKRSVHLGYQRASAVYFWRTPLPLCVLNTSGRDHTQVHVVEPYNFEQQGDRTAQRDIFPRRNRRGPHRAEGCTGLEYCAVGVAGPPHSRGA